MNGDAVARQVDQGDLHVKNKNDVQVTVRFDSLTSEPSHAKSNGPVVPNAIVMISVEAVVRGLTENTSMPLPECTAMKTSVPPSTKARLVGELSSSVILANMVKGDRRMHGNIR